MQYYDLHLTCDLCGTETKEGAILAVAVDGEVEQIKLCAKCDTDREGLMLVAEEESDIRFARKSILARQRRD